MKSPLRLYYLERLANYILQISPSKKKEEIFFTFSASFRAYFASKLFITVSDDPPRLEKYS
jgi:hypothetical protein